MIIDDKSRAIVIMWNNIKPQRGIKLKRSIDRGVVFLSKNKSFPTAFARLCGILPALLP